MKAILAIGGIIMLLMVGVIGWEMGVLTTEKSQTVGSVGIGGEYHYSNAVPGSVSSVIKSTPGTVGSLVITGTGGAVTIYNATTTNANLRATAATTSLPIIADFPASTAVGTYTLDAIASYGILEVITGTSGTSTLTWR